MFSLCYFQLSRQKEDGDNIETFVPILNIVIMMKLIMIIYLKKNGVLL
jgi:hypothetical protein